MSYLKIVEYFGIDGKPCLMGDAARCDVTYLDGDDFADYVLCDDDDDSEGDEGDFWAGQITHIRPIYDEHPAPPVVTSQSPVGGTEM